nr:PfkB family carbohydrate kinase [Streptomyces sp. TS71-3]
MVALGESMVTFLPSRPGRLADVPAFERAIGGAESNVAVGLAGAGHTAKWVSRVGTDGFGDHLVERIASYGVDTCDVQRDPRRPTGIYFRTAGERAVSRGAPGASGTAGGTGASGDPGASEDPGVPAAPASPSVGPSAQPSSERPSAGLAEVVYYRAGSAASAMSPANMPADVLRSGRVLHLTGITAALSADCRALLDDLTTRPALRAPDEGGPAGSRDADERGPADSRDADERGPADSRAAGDGGPAGSRPADRTAAAHRPLLSFDVNYRVSLWGPADRPGETLLALARRCDLVFVGEDEAEAAWHVTGGPAAVRALLPEPRLLVVKQGATGVTVFHREQGEERAPRAADAAGAPDTVTFVPALHVDVVAPVGAGDAFAAGFLSGTLRGLPVRDRVRHGHLMAAAALTVPGDLGDPGTAAGGGAAGAWQARADRLAALDEEAWGTLRLGPGWTRDMAGAGRAGARDAHGAGPRAQGSGADEEGRTP